MNLICNKSKTCQCEIKPFVFCKPSLALAGTRQPGFEHECFSLMERGENAVIKLIECPSDTHDNPTDKGI